MKDNYPILKGQPITPEELTRLLESAEVIDLNNVTNIADIAEEIKPCNASTESYSDGHSPRN